MRKEFKNFIEEHALVEPKSRILLAVSGGIDSMVMLHLFHSCGYRFAVAHCNFNLRGAESDGDEALVREICQTLGVELFVKHFQTAKYSADNNVSIQVAARELRYQWFSMLCKENDFASVATAHNKNDVAETLLLNLSRGTGLKGLTGIKPNINGIIRPLLFAFRSQIEAYAVENGIHYRNDSSNVKIKYARNRIRHNILPELEQINQGVIENIYSTSLFLSETWKSIEGMNDDFRPRVRREETNEIHYAIQMLASYPFRQLFLIEELVDFSFSPATIIDIEKSLHTQSGKVFYSPTHQLIRDREALIVSPVKEPSKEVRVYIEEGVKHVSYPLDIKLGVVPLDARFQIPRSRSVAVLDYDKLQFPLILRSWRDGDWFIPFGMNGRKKVSDFLIDQKVPLHRKGSVYVLESNGEIVWVVDFRIDNRYRLKADSQRVLLAEII
ncbi:MAG: tRNA lysidine(34) synthetase TilS [Tenuifilaceae bacterium]|jgi:tRNA(Ile)-lysidine synthase|nr:tRNA lysidine(34) synthetase TilS [Tenuifilaceae bacterium]